MNKKLFSLIVLSVLFVLLASSAASAITTYVYWPDGSTLERNVPSNRVVEFNYTVILPSTNNMQTEIFLIRDNDFANPVTTLYSVSSQGTTFGNATIDAQYLVDNANYTIWAQSVDTTTSAQSFGVLDFNTTTTPVVIGNPPAFLSAFYFVYNLATQTTANVVNLSNHVTHPDNLPMTFSLDQLFSNPAIVDCSLLPPSEEEVFCNLNGVGITTFDAIVSDGTLSDRTSITIEVINSSAQPASPEFRSNLSLFYSYDIALVNVDVVNLSNYAFHPAGLPISFALDQSVTDLSIVDCELPLPGEEVLNCDLNGVGTTTLDAVVSDGSLTDTVTITIEVFNSTSANQPPQINVSPVLLTQYGMQFVFDFPSNTFDPDGDPMTYGFNLGSTNPSIINNCILLPNDQLFCNAIGDGSTVVNLSVSDGVHTVHALLPITVNTGVNFTPYFDNLSRFYQFDLALGSVSVVDLSQFAVDPRGLPLTYSLDQSLTDLSVIDCELDFNTAGIQSVLDCDLLSVGTTTVDVTISNGVQQTTARLTIEVFEQGPLGPVAQITSPTARNEEADNIFFDGRQSFARSNGTIVAYQWNVTSSSGRVVATSFISDFTIAPLSPGRYRAHLTVIDSHGLSNSTERWFTVYAQAPEFEDVNRGSLMIRDVQVWGVDFERACLGCKNQVEVTATVENTGRNSIRNLRMTYTIPEYGLQARTAAQTIRPGELTTITLLVELPFDMQPGVYYPITTFTDGTLRRVRPGYLEVWG